MHELPLFVPQEDHNPPLNQTHLHVCILESTPIGCHAYSPLVVSCVGLKQPVVL
jgi:hypothetical protein